jgi:hypothetical protein
MRATAAAPLTDAALRALWQQRCALATPQMLKYYYDIHTRAAIQNPRDKQAEIMAQAALSERSAREARH